MFKERILSLLRRKGYAKPAESATITVNTKDLLETGEPETIMVVPGKLKMEIKSFVINPENISRKPGKKLGK